MPLRKFQTFAKFIWIPFPTYARTSFEGMVCFFLSSRLYRLKYDISPHIKARRTPKSELSCHKSVGHMHLQIIRPPPPTTY